MHFRPPLRQNLLGVRAVRLLPGDSEEYVSLSLHARINIHAKDLALRPFCFNFKRKDLKIFIMQADKYDSASSAATAKHQLTINDLDDYSLGMIFNKLAYRDRTRMELVCLRWHAICKVSWSTYTKSLRINADLIHPSYETKERRIILIKIMKRLGPYLERIIFNPNIWYCQRFRPGTISWLAKVCPKLKRVNASKLMLNDYDWLACCNFEALRLSNLKKYNVGELFRRNKRLHRLEILFSDGLTDRDFDDLDPGQLKFLHIELCENFKFTAAVSDKLAESLVELKYNSWRDNLQHLSKLKNLQFLHLKNYILDRLEITRLIADIAQNLLKLEYLALVIVTYPPCIYGANDLAPLFNMPSLRKLLIISSYNNITPEERDSLLGRAPQLEIFAIGRWAQVSHLFSHYRHIGDWLS